MPKSKEELNEFLSNLRILCETHQIRIKENRVLNLSDLDGRYADLINYEYDQKYLTNGAQTPLITIEQKTGNSDELNKLINEMFDKEAFEVETRINWFRCPSVNKGQNCKLPFKHTGNCSAISKTGSFWNDRIEKNKYSKMCRETTFLGTELNKHRITPRMVARLKQKLATRKT